MKNGADPGTSKTASDEEEEIDYYSVKPEFYDPELDNRDESWAQKKRGGRRTSDATLSCPACFTTLCLDSQRHEKKVTRYRAIFVVNCKIEDKPQLGSKRKRGRRNGEPETSPASADGAETFKHVCCGMCSTKVGVIDEDEVYHFLNVLPSEC